MVITKDDLAPPPYSAQPAADQSKPAEPAQTLAVQSSQFPQASSSTAGSSAGPLLPTHTHAHAGRPSDTLADALAGRLARHRFLVAFLWAILIWLVAGLILGGAGAMDYGRHPGHGRDGRRH